MTNKNSKITKRQKRHKRVRAKVFGNAARPRLSIFRSNRYIYGQLIDDKKGHTLLAAADGEIKDSKEKKNKTETAKLTGQLLAEKAKKLGIKAIVFDRGGYRYHGRVRALAEGAREGGLEF